MQKKSMLSLSIKLLFCMLQLNGCSHRTDSNLVKEMAAGNYTTLKMSLKRDRDSLVSVYQALPDVEQTIFLSETIKPLLRNHLENDLIPWWYGTAWDFNGISQVPGEGQIACGYFVSTLLRDLGFSLERYKLAQQASMNIVKSLAPQGYRWDWSNISAATLTEKIQNMPKGFYVIGLDNHVGFMLHDEDGSVWFLHSSYLDPVAVVREKAVCSEALEASNRYVLGYLESDWLVKKWLHNTKIATVKG